MKKLTVLLMLSILLFTCGVPSVHATDVEQISGFTTGPSYQSVVPMKRVTFVNFDEYTSLDDYAYLAAVPTAVFGHKGKIFSNPLLFYQDKLKEENQTYLSLDARSGIDYFMEDWMAYCDGQLDKITTINIQKEKLDSSWKAKNYTTVESDNPYDLARKIALNEWSFSENAVIAVISEDLANTSSQPPIIEKGTIPAGKDVIEFTFYTKKLSKITPRSQFFTIPEGYTYLKARTWWSSFWFGSPAMGGLPVNINITIPGGSPDSQFYCKYDDLWLETALSQGWNAGGMDIEKVESHIYKVGEWRLSITDIPTFKIFGKTGRIIDIIRNMMKEVTYQTDISLFPGEDLKTQTPISPPFGSRDVIFKLTWDDPQTKLGFTLIGPSGEAVKTAYNESTLTKIEMHLDQLGECPKGKSYHISVFSMNGFSKNVNYQIEYTWEQNISRMQCDFLTAATNGAVLASVLNAPLLYISPSAMPDTTSDALYTLGVENVYLVNLGNHLSKETKNKINEIAPIHENYIDAITMYKALINITNQHDIIFSTIDPWTYWYVPETAPAGETKAGLFIGPAAYIAAHHGSPVLIVDYHPELSSAIVWHTEFWKQYGNGYTEPSVAPMYLTGKQVYDFLNKIGLDKEGQETMITIADQYDIGATWDRVFAGVARPGRFFGSPVDTAYWIARDVFYPALIFNNPAMNTNGVELTQGSYSARRKFLPWGRSGLKITKQSQDEKFKYPVMQTYICYEHNLNAQFEKYYGFKYQTPDGYIPGESVTNEPIDQDIMPGMAGQIWPDMSPSEVLPAYLEKGGFDSVFSTSYKAITDNLNRGVLLWCSGLHGDSSESGYAITWDPADSFYGSLRIGKLMAYQKQENPWRAYDWYLGSTENPDTMTAESHGIIAAFLGNPTYKGLLFSNVFPLTEELSSSEKPIRNKLASIPIIKWFLPKGWRDTTLYKDGTIISRTITIGATANTLLTGWNQEKDLKNIHSMGWLTQACLDAYKYWHLVMVRHGSSFQIIDPWSTSWYSVVWFQSIPRDIILGDTVGEAYTKGIKHTGILYLGGGADGGPQWWWDLEENVCLFGDPDLRIYVPDIKYSDSNHWDKPGSLHYEETLDLNGHMPYGVTGYPNVKKPSPWQHYLWIILAVILIVTLVLIMSTISRRKRKKIEKNSEEYLQ